MLDDLASFGYVAAELADWVGSTSAEKVAEASGVASGLAQGASGVRAPLVLYAINQVNKHVH